MTRKNDLSGSTQSLDPHRPADTCAGESELSFISTDYRETGLAQLYLYRRKGSKRSLGAFFIDLRGAGVVDSFAQTEMTHAHYECAVHENCQAPDLEPIAPTSAYQILRATLADSLAADAPPTQAATIAAPFLERLESSTPASPSRLLETARRDPAR